MVPGLSAEKVQVQKERIRQNSSVTGESLPDTPVFEASSDWHSTVETAVTEKPLTEEGSTVEDGEGEGEEKADKGKEKEKGKETEKEKEKLDEPAAKKFRGIPENVELFEVFWQQVVELIKVR